MYTIYICIYLQVAELNSTRCNFIRCIKPNYQMEVGVFDVQYSVLQLRCVTLTMYTYTRRRAVQRAAAAVR